MTAENDADYAKLQLKLKLCQEKLEASENTLFKVNSKYKKLLSDSQSQKSKLYYYRNLCTKNIL